MFTLYCVWNSIHNDDVTTSQWHFIFGIHEITCCISNLRCVSWTNTIKAFMIIIHNLNRYQRNAGMITQYCVSNSINNKNTTTSHWYWWLNINKINCLMSVYDLEFIIVYVLIHAVVVLILTLQWNHHSLTHESRRKTAETSEEKHKSSKLYKIQ